MGVGSGFCLVHEVPKAVHQVGDDGGVGGEFRGGHISIGEYLFDYAGVGFVGTVEHHNVDVVLGGEFGVAGEIPEGGPNDGAGHIVGDITEPGFDRVQ